MDLSERITQAVTQLPAELKQLLDSEITAGNQLIDIEVGRGEHQGKTVLVLKHPFRTDPAHAPPGVAYREFKDREPQIFEFYTADQRLTLITAKFKPMVLQKIQGPPNPTEEHIKRMEAIAKRDEAADAERKAQANEPPKPVRDPNLADAGNRFIASMTMTFDMWHDGLGYDLDALDRLTPHERDAIETVLINHHPRDWRDIEALARIDSPRARAAVEAGLKSGDAHVRREAMHHAGEKIDPADRERLLIQTLQTKGLYDGLSEAIDEVPDFHPPAVVDALFKGALNGDGQAAVHFAALLYFLHGKAKEPFDWDHRPFFLRFNTTDRNERRTAFKDLCETVGVDVARYMR